VLTGRLQFTRDDWHWAIKCDRRTLISEVEAGRAASMVPRAQYLADAAEARETARSLRAAGRGCGGTRRRPGTGRHCRGTGAATTVDRRAHAAYLKERQRDCVTAIHPLVVLWDHSLERENKADPRRDYQ
jgi:hypothetical protein